nr:MAG TPA: hypothetical protein [Caudoviricetes sp.]
MQCRSSLLLANKSPAQINIRNGLCFFRTNYL